MNSDGFLLGDSVLVEPLHRRLLVVLRRVLHLLLRHLDQFEQKFQRKIFKFTDDKDYKTTLTTLMTTTTATIGATKSEVQREMHSVWSSVHAGTKIVKPFRL